jgi:hypothetical protein
LCRSTVSATKKHNVERHFKTNHKDFDTKFPLSSDVRKKRMCDLKSELSFQQSVFTRTVQQSKKCTLASYKVMMLSQEVCRRANAI